MNLTFKQRSILALVVAGNPDGPIDFDQLISRLPYITTKQSMQFSVRALMAKGLIEKGPKEIRRERSRRIFTITPLGEHWAKLLCPPIPEPQPVDELLGEDVVAELSQEILVPPINLSLDLMNYGIE